MCFAQEFCECYRLRDEENFVRGLRTLIERRGPNQVREIAEATRQIGNMELTEMVTALMGAKDAVPYNAFSEYIGFSNFVAVGFGDLGFCRCFAHS